MENEGSKVTKESIVHDIENICYDDDGTSLMIFIYKLQREIDSILDVFGVISLGDILRLVYDIFPIYKPGAKSFKVDDLLIDFECYKIGYTKNTGCKLDIVSVPNEGEHEKEWWNRKWYYQIKLPDAMDIFDTIIADI